MDSEFQLYQNKNYIEYLYRIHLFYRLKVIGNFTRASIQILNSKVTESRL